MLAERYPRSGGDIKNAVLKAAQIATTEPGPDAAKRIHQRHFVQGMEEVVAGTSVMAQSLFEENGAAPPAGFVEEMSDAQEALRAELALIVERIDGLERKQTGALQKLDDRQTAALSRRHRIAQRHRRRTPRMPHPLDRRDGCACTCCAALLSHSARPPDRDRLTA